jgi:DtxR family Mn-dependent transcriptional regulator
MQEISSNLEDYLETIFSLEAAHSAARAKDIADHMGVQRASVTNALQKLAKQGLINYEPYSSVTLTPEGFRVATRIAHRHKVLSDFLRRVLNIRPELAEETACKLEHGIDDESLEALIRFVRFVSRCPRTGADWIAAFQHTCVEPGTCPDCTGCIEGCLARQQSRCVEKSSLPQGESAS